MHCGASQKHSNGGRSVTRRKAVKCNAAFPRNTYVTPMHNSAASYKEKETMLLYITPMHSSAARNIYNGAMKVFPARGSHNLPPPPQKQYSFST